MKGVGSEKHIFSFAENFSYTLVTSTTDPVLLEVHSKTRIETFPSPMAGHYLFRLFRGCFSSDSVHLFSKADPVMLQYLKNVLRNTKLPSGVQIYCNNSNPYWKNESPNPEMDVLLKDPTLWELCKAFLSHYRIGDFFTFQLIEKSETVIKYRFYYRWKE